MGWRNVLSRSSTGLRSTPEDRSRSSRRICAATAPPKLAATNDREPPKFVSGVFDTGSQVVSFSGDGHVLLNAITLPVRPEVKSQGGDPGVREGLGHCRVQSTLVFGRGDAMGEYYGLVGRTRGASGDRTKHEPLCATVSDFFCSHRHGRYTCLLKPKCRGSCLYVACSNAASGFVGYTSGFQVHQAKEVACIL